jgi:uncharacterized membrane protein YfcA
METFIDKIFYFPEAISTFAGFFIIGISFFTSFITAAFGIGGGMIMVAVLAVLLPPAALIPVHAVVQIGSNLGRAAVLWKHLELRSLIPFFIASVVGVAIGGMISVNIPPAFVLAGLAVFILWSVFGKLPQFGGKSLVAGGLISAFLTMFFGATGMFISAMVKSMRLHKLQHVATHGIMMGWQHLLKFIAFGLLGFVYGPYIPLIIFTIISGQLGTIVGKHMLMKIDDAMFQKILSGILTVLAIRMLWQAAEMHFGFSLF